MPKTDTKQINANAVHTCITAMDDVDGHFEEPSTHDVFFPCEPS